MFKSAVNLGAAGHNPVRYMQDGGSPAPIDLQAVSTPYQRNTGELTLSMQEAQSPAFQTEYEDEFFVNSPLGYAAYEDGTPFEGEAGKWAQPAAPMEQMLRGVRGEVGAPERSVGSGDPQNVQDLIQIFQFLQQKPESQLTQQERVLLEEIPRYLSMTTGMANGGAVSDYMAPPDLDSVSPGSRPAYLDYVAPEPRVMPEEQGLGTVFYDKIFGDDVTEGVRESARVGGSRTAALYGSDPTFMEQLITEYNYPGEIDPDLGRVVIPTEGPEAVRYARPEGRRDMPTYPELEDARAHMLGSALMAREYGPETAASAGSFGEFLDRFAPFPLGGQNARDVAMDERNNAVGRQIFMRAGMNASPEQLTQMVDAEIFRQLDVIMGRTPAEQNTPDPSTPRAPRNFVSPDTGPDVYFPRNEQGYFDTTRRVLGFSPRRYRNY